MTVQGDFVVKVRRLYRYFRMGLADPALWLRKQLSLNINFRVASLMFGRLYPRGKPPVLILYETEWTPRPVWTRRSEENLHPFDTRDRIRTFQLVTKCLATWATWPTLSSVKIVLMWCTYSQKLFIVGVKILHVIYESVDCDSTLVSH